MLLAAYLILLLFVASVGVSCVAVGNDGLALVIFALVAADVALLWREYQPMAYFWRWVDLRRYGRKPD